MELSFQAASDSYPQFPVMADFLNCPGHPVFPAILAYLYSEGQKMSSTADRMRLCEDILAIIDRRRAETGDVFLGSGIEKIILDMQVHELEQDILEHPGAIEPWLIRPRHGQA